MELIFILSVVGLTSCIVGLYKLFYYNYVTKNYIQTEGTFFDYASESTYNPSTELTDKIYRPMIRYTVNGETHTLKYYKAVVSPMKASSMIGQQIPLYYSETEPNNVIVSGDNGIRHIIIGLVCLIIPVYAIFFI